MNTYKAMIAGVAVLAVPALCSAAVVSLSASDSFGSSSFNSAGNWDSGAAPTSGNDYVTGDFRLRTPADGGSHTFAGDSLTVNNSNGYSASLMFKGTGSSGSITIANLIMNGGMISHANGTGDICNLYGGMNFAGASTLYAKQGPVNVYSVISGAGQITNQAGDGNTVQRVVIQSSSNTFTGNIVNNGRLELVDNANLNFVIGASGVNNGISDGGSQQSCNLDGDFVFDLSSAGTTIGDSWTIVDTTAASTSYGATFTVSGFADQGDDTWYLDNGSAEYSFDESTGTLTVIPEPATLGLVGIFGAGALFIRRRFMI